MPKISKTGTSSSRYTQPFSHKKRLILEYKSPLFLHYKIQYEQNTFSYTIFLYFCL